MAWLPRKTSLWRIPVGFWSNIMSAGMWRPVCYQYGKEILYIVKWSVGGGLQNVVSTLEQISIQDQFLFEVLVDSNHVSECYQTVGTCIWKLVLYFVDFCSYSTEQIMAEWISRTAHILRAGVSIQLYAAWCFPESHHSEFMMCVQLTLKIPQMRIN